MPRTKTTDCTACGQPLGEARIVVHDISGKLTGEYHTLDCLTRADAQSQRLPVADPDQLDLPMPHRASC